MTIEDAIAAAEEILPGNPSLDEQGKDPRWQAIIAVGEFIETNPEEVWAFVGKWGCHPDSDLRAAISTCLLEHLLEHHFEDYIGRVEELASGDRNFADTVSSIWEFGQSEHPANRKRLRTLRRKVR